MADTARQSRTYLPERKPASGEIVTDAVVFVLATSVSAAGRITAVIQPMTRLLSVRAALRAVSTTTHRYIIGLHWAARHGAICGKQLTYTVTPGQMRCVCVCGADRWV